MSSRPETLAERDLGLHRIELRRLLDGSLSMLDHYPIGATDKPQPRELRLPEWAETIKVRPTAEQIAWIIDYGEPQIAD
jgi:hypothetical protein